MAHVAKRTAPVLVFSKLYLEEKKKDNKGEQWVFSYGTTSVCLILYIFSLSDVRK